jgi:hypothetical protein
MTLPPKVKDRAGNRYGRIVVVEFSHLAEHTSWWHCRCDCGRTLVLRGSALNVGQTTSCGCKRTETNTRTPPNLSGSGRRARACRCGC